MKPPFLFVLTGWFVALLAAASTLSIGVAFAQNTTERPVRITEKALAQIQALREEKALRTPAQKKLDSRLIYGDKVVRRAPLVERVPSLRSTLEIAPDNTVLVDIKARVTPWLLEEIDRLGGTVISSFEQYEAIRASVPLEQIEPLAGHEDIRFIEPAAKAFTNKVNTSEGDVAHSAPLARDTFGVDGSGVKIGVLSDSVDHLATVQATGDLPDVTVLEDSPGLTGEGTAMLEIVHDLAPGAELYFATAWTGAAGFAANIEALGAAGCHVIVDDVSYFNESPFQDDIISQAVNTVTGDGALYFSSAGNSGNLNDGQSGVWEGNSNGMTDGSLPGGLGAMTVHDFGGGDTTNRLTTDPPFGIALFWADPLGASTKDYDLYLLSPEGDTIYVASTNFQGGNDDPYEFIDSGPWNDTNNLLVISMPEGDNNRFIHLNTNRGRLEHGTAGQIKGHQAAAQAFAVAAVDAQGRTSAFHGTESVETFSSDGPRRVFYYPDGTPITPGNVSSTGGEVRPKPDLAAADGVATATSWFNPFYGTSASAPHAAAVAGLLLSKKPSLTPAKARAALTGAALDIEPTGWDRDSGAGIVMADGALSYDDLLVSPTEGFRSSGPKGGPFMPLSKGYVLQNTTDTSIGWEVTKQDDWLTLSSPSSGTLNPGESITVTVSIDEPANTLEKGTYSATVHFNNTSTGAGDTTKEVTLHVVDRVLPGVLMLLTKAPALYEWPWMALSYASLRP
ncbi:MAG: S8 family serine peptidase [Thermodesulfobacteriota bacterium]|nr:S8 family serine peptidase [Thermodesulfobacteriota bacterium]